MRKPQDDACYICSKTFTAALAEDGASGWAFHWNSPFGTTVSAETCSEACSTTFETTYRDAKRNVTV